jgi:hypothetical protein
MPLLFEHSVHTGHYRIARQPRIYLGKHSAAWITIELAFSVPERALSFWALADALAKAGSGDMHPHAFLRYCIRQRWLERVEG